MAEPGATPSHQLFAGFNAFFSSTWKKTRVEQVALEVFHLWCILGHPNEIFIAISNLASQQINLHLKLYIGIHI